MLKSSAVFIFAWSVAFLNTASVSAQVTPDNTLGSENSSVSGDINVEINGGAQRGSNLFHSFKQFSIPENFSAYFNNPVSVQRVFARVTGNNPSSINGIIRANGTADLYLINPAGINFLPNAALEIGGSFVGTTANAVEFADGGRYPAGLGEGKRPLLTSTVPIGLGLLGKNPVSVLNSGHTLVGSLATPLTETAPNAGLAVLPGKTIALIGGNIIADGGVVRASDGHIELGAVEEGTVKIDSALENFDYEAVTKGDIQLSQFSLIDARGATGGSIAATAGQFALATGSVLYTSSFGNGFQPTGIDVSAENFSIGGPSSDFRDSARVASTPNNFSMRRSPLQSSGLFIDNYGSGVAGDIRITANRLSLSDGGLAYQRSFASGAPGNIDVSSQSVSLTAPDPTSPGVLSAIAATNFGPTSTQNNRFVGDVSIKTEALRLFDGGFISTATVGSGSSGDINIDAKDVLISSASQPLQLPSSISSGALLIGPNLPTGNTGKTKINTDSLRILNGGTIINSSNSLGNAGSIAVQANNFIEIDGAKNGVNSQISSQAITLSQPIKDFFNLASNPTGDAGRVSIETPTLILSNGGKIGVANEGTGNAGDIAIQTARTEVLSAGQIAASTNGGNGGNIDLASNSLLVGGDSGITASANRGGQGGNVIINSNGVALFPSSSITANAEQGAGGRVVISTNALLRSPNSTITATSAAGPELNGVVDIQAPDTTPQPEARVTPDVVGVPELTAACTGGGGRNEFVVTGRGGLPRSPASLQQSYSGWQTPLVSAEANPINRPTEILEATGWVSNGDGTVDFVSQSSSPVSSAPKTACLHESGDQNRS